MSRKELNLDTTVAYRLINKWGPCTRTIITLLRREDLDASEIARLKRTIASLEEDNEQLRAEKDAKESPR